MSDKIMFMNTQGFKNKKDKINEIVRTKQPMVLAIAEHFQNNQDLLNCIEGYTVRSSFCRESKNEKGGVAILVRNDLECKPREELDAYCEKKSFEVATVEIPSINLVVSAVYKHPPSGKKQFYSNLNSLLETFKSESEKRHVIAGDFNIDLSQNKAVTQVMQKNGFNSTLSESTHDYGACYDNFIVDFKPQKTRVMRGDFDKISDHHPIELILGSSKDKKYINSEPPSQDSKDSALSLKTVVPSKQSSPTLSERKVSSSRISSPKSIPMYSLTEPPPTLFDLFVHDVRRNMVFEERGASSSSISTLTRGLNDCEISSTRKTNPKGENKYSTSSRLSTFPLDSTAKLTRGLNDCEISSTRKTNPKGENKYRTSSRLSTFPLDSTAKLTRGLNDCEISSTRKTNPKEENKYRTSSRLSTFPLDSTAKLTRGLNDCEISSTRKTNPKGENKYSTSSRLSTFPLDSTAKLTRGLNDVEMSSLISTKPKAGNKHTASTPSSAASLDPIPGLTHGLKEMKVSSTSSKSSKPKCKTKTVPTQPSPTALDSISSLSSNRKSSEASSTRGRKPKTMDVLY